MSAKGLYDPARHVRVVAPPWDAAGARAAARRVVVELRATAGPDGRYPPHPLDAPAGSRPASGLYDGAAGVVLALRELAGAGIEAGDQGALARWAAALVDRYRAEPDTGSREPALLVGEVGVLLVAAEAGVAGADEELLAALAAARPDGPPDLLWGPPGRAVAALRRHVATGDDRFADAFRRCVEPLLTGRVDVGQQALWGEVHRYVGAAHGVVGALGPALLGGALVSEAERRAALDRLLVALVRTACRGPVGVNWPTEGGRAPALVQWCHGAPGVLVTLAGVPAGEDDRLDELLDGAARLVEAAGPLAKGSNLCHGTAGNALALLAQHQRTGAARWRAAAERLGAAALVQLDEERRRHGRGHPSLFTGHAGVAVALVRLADGGPADLPGLGLPPREAQAGPGVG